MFNMKRVLGNKGFTLVELLVVTAVLGILVALMVPSYKGIMARSHMGKCASNLRQIGAAMHMYAADNNNAIFPDARLDPTGQAELPSDVYGRWIGAVHEALGEPTTIPPSSEFQGRPLNVLICPADPTRGGWKYLGAPEGLTGDAGAVGINAHSYLPNRLILNRRLTEIIRPSKTIIFTDYGWAQIGTRAIFALSNPWMQYFPDRWHNKLVNCLFVDGHVEPLAIASLQNGQPNAELWFADYPNSDLSYK